MGKGISMSFCMVTLLKYLICYSCSNMKSSLIKLREVFCFFKPVMPLKNCIGVDFRFYILYEIVERVRADFGILNQGKCEEHTVLYNYYTCGQAHGSFFVDFLSLSVLLYIQYFVLYFPSILTCKLA